MLPHITCTPVSSTSSHGHSTSLSTTFCRQPRAVLHVCMAASHSPEHVECSASSMQEQAGQHQGEAGACHQDSSCSVRPVAHPSNSSSRPEGLHEGDAEHVAAMMASGLALVPAPAPAPRLRFWVDEVLWSQGYPAVQLLEEVLCQAGGVRAGGVQGKAAAAAAARDPHGRHLGHSHVKEWDLLWTKSTYALKAVPQLRPGQCVSVVVGLNSLTMKKRMLQTLKAAYGAAAAAQITPLSFALPEELPQWRAYMQLKQQEQDQAQGQQGQEELWMLKTGQDAGKGLLLLPINQAVAVAEREAAARDPSQSHLYQLQVAQLYLTRPLLLEGRKMHLRLWLVVTAHHPLQAYLHRRGLVLFSSELYDANTPWVPIAVNSQQDVKVAQHHRTHSGRKHTAAWSPGRHSNGSTLASQHGQVHPGHSIEDSRLSLPLLPLDTSTQASGTVYSNDKAGVRQIEGDMKSINAAAATSSTQAALSSTDSCPQRSTGAVHVSTNGHKSSTGSNADSNAGTGNKHALVKADTAVSTRASTSLAPMRLAPGHVTNLARNSSGMVWTLKQLEQRLGTAAYQQLWSALQRLLRLALMAAHGPMQEAHAWLKPPFPQYGFQLLGMDFLVDEHLRPWLLEANSSPSIMALHDDPSTAELVHQEKQQMLSDMFSLIAHRVYPPGAETPSCSKPPLGEFIDLFAGDGASSS